MIEAEQVICGLFNGLGWRIVKSPKIYQLSENALKEILKGIKIEAETRLCRFLTLDGEHFVAVSYLKPQYDPEYGGRQGVWNNTILIPIADYLKLTEPIKIVEPYFTKASSDPPAQLKPVQIGK